MELKGRWVQFAIRDIYFPSTEAVLDELHGDDELSGQIVDTSDRGGEAAGFLVVQVSGVEAPIVIPIERVRRWNQPATS